MKTIIRKYHAAATDKGTGTTAKGKDAATVAPEPTPEVQAQETPAKTIKDVYASLKLRTDETTVTVPVTVGDTVLDVTLPIRVLANRDGSAVFIHVTPTAILGTLDVKDDVTVFTTVTEDSDAVTLLDGFRKERTYTPGQTQSLPVSDDIKDLLLKSVPAGFKLVMDKDGSMRMVKTRNRAKTVNTGETSKTFVDPALAGSLDD